MLEINEIEYCKINVKYTANPSVVISKGEDAIKELKKLPVPGFRPGKAPANAVKAKYKQKIDAWVRNDMISYAHDDILFETKIQPIGQPQVLDVQLNGNNFNCEFLILKKPEFELKEVKGLEIPKPHEKVTQAAYVEELLQELRTKNGDSIPYSDTDFVQLGDVVTLDYKTDIKRSITGSGDLPTEEEGKLYTVGQNLFPEFDDNIVGMTPGETRDFNILINEEKAAISVNLHMGMKKVPAPLDDSLAVKVGVENIIKLREVVEGIATNRLKQYEQGQIAEQIKKQLIAMHPFELPSWLVQMEIDQLSQNMGVKIDELSDEAKEGLKKRAEDSVRFALILDTVRGKVPEADLSDHEVINLIKQRVVGQVPDVDLFLLDMQKKGQLVSTVAQVRNEITLQFLIENAKIVE